MKRINDRSLFRALIIYEATVENDNIKIWDKKELREIHSSSNPIDIINLVLQGEAKSQAYMCISKFSGFEDDDLTHNKLLKQILQPGGN